MGLFGSVGKLFSAPISAQGDFLNSAMSPFGLGGEQGEYYRPGMNPADAWLMNESRRKNAVNENQLQGDLNKYAQGGMSYNEMLNAINRGDGLQRMGYAEGLATNPLTGSRFAAEQVQNSPILSSLFGKGGSMEGARAEEKDLMSRGYKLQPEDIEAYGQASGDIARQFGQSEKNLANSLAMRGLSNSGAASGAQFSGLQGNKMEQLAKAQTAIADKRMANTLNRLNSTRSYLGGLGQLGEEATQNQYGRNLAGLEYTDRSRAGLINQLQNNYGINEGFNQNSLASKKANKGKTLFEAFGNGLYSGTAGVGAQVPGMLMGGAGGGSPGMAASGAGSAGASSYGIRPQAYG